MLEVYEAERFHKVFNSEHKSIPFEEFLSLNGSVCFIPLNKEQQQTEDYNVLN